MSQWYKYDVADVALEFATDIKNGKTNLKHEKKRRGDNTVFLLPTVDSKSTLKKLTSDASVAFLAVIYILAAFMGYQLEALFGLTFLFVLLGISFAVKNASSKRIANSYRLLLPSAIVIENGIRIRLSAFDVDVGDLIEFSQGDIIPADARIVFADNLTVAERYVDLMSGKVGYRREDKNSDVASNIDDGMDTYSNIVYAASVVVSGNGRAIVTETGTDTKLYGNKSAMRIASNNDATEYFSRFYNNAKTTSLIAFLCVIPLTLLSLILKSPISPGDQRFDLLYTLLLLVALSVTCMSEFVISHAESLVTKELLISSRNDKAKNNVDSRITKLSSAEAIADTDTVLILSPDVLVDNRFKLRRVLFSDKTYRFDTLRSNDLSYFFDCVGRIARYSNKENLSKELTAAKIFLEENNLNNIDAALDSRKPKFLRNFPVPGSRACVFETDDLGRPTRCIFYTKELRLAERCTEFRTEGGGLWKTDPKIIERVCSGYSSFEDVGLSPILFISLDNDRFVFEGMIGVGQEYPFADGNLAEEFTVSGIHPIVFFDKETQSNLTLIRECGLISNENEVALASEYFRNGMDIADAPITTKAYIGFDRKNISKLTDRLTRNGRKILPVIKDSVDRSAISPLSVYAVHSTESYESVKISASLSIQPADSDVRKGGIFDILKMIRGSSMARLKLGMYKNYLAFSMLLRTVAVCCSLLIGKSGTNLTSINILSMGFVCDAIALISFMMSKGIPVKPKEAAWESKVMFSSTLFLFFLIAGAVSGVAIFATTEVLLSLEKLQLITSSMFLSCSIVFSQVVSLGGFLVLLNKRCRRRTLNWFYLLILIALTAFMIVLNLLSGDMYKILSPFNIYRMSIDMFPFIALISLFSLVSVLFITKLLSSIFCTSNK